MTLEEQEKAARARFQSFHGRAPRSSELAIMGDLRSPTVALECGPLVGLAYRALGDQNFHEFDGSCGARVFVSYDGKQVWIVGGCYTFTERGFIR